MLVHVTACALSNFSKVRAAGKHPSFRTQPPFVAGFDGAGRLDDGRRVYFSFPRPPFGSMAERTVVPAVNCIPAPDGVDDITLAAIADLGFSAWAALVSRARFAPGETVLVNGATGTAGSMAVQIAKVLGAAKVIATGRNAAALTRLHELGADATVILNEGLARTGDGLREHFEAGVDVVLDYLWGTSAAQLLEAAAAGRRAPLRFVQIGAASGESLHLDARVLRHSSIELLGCSVANVSPVDIGAAVSDLIGSSATANYRIETRPVSLAHIEDVWSQASATPRIVFA